MKRLFRFLPALAIIFASGISGAWWSAQFTAPLPTAWGWFGAVIIGITLWAGVEIAVRGERAGWIIAAVAAGMDVVMAGLYFSAHPPLVAWSLALAQPLITLLVAYQSALYERRAALEAEARRREELEAERKRQEAEDRHRRRLETMRLKAELAAAAPDTSGRDRTMSAVPDTRAKRNGHMSAADRRAWLAGREGPVNPRELADMWQVSERTVRRDLRAAGYQPDGSGMWHRHQMEVVE